MHLICLFPNEFLSKILFKIYIFVNRKKDLGGGTVLDLGVYTIQVCQWAFQSEPLSIAATGKLNHDGVDAEMSAELKYADHKVGQIKTSGLKTQHNSAKIVGTKGTMTVDQVFLLSSSSSKWIRKSIHAHYICHLCLDSIILVSNIRDRCGWIRENMAIAISQTSFQLSKQLWFTI